MGYYESQVLPRLIDVILSTGEFPAIRARVAAGLSGDVLEIGFGSGRNLPHYPPAVTRVQAVDPAEVGRTLATGRVAACAAPVEYVGLDGQDLPVADGSVDHVLATWTLCTIPDAERALAEVARVLRPGGTFRFVEHGLSPDPRVARWQHRLTPLQRRIGGGCHLDRPIDDLVASSELELVTLDTYYIKGPRPFGYQFEGVAVRR